MALTNDLVLKCLILAEGICVSFRFVIFTSEVLNGLIVEKTIGMNTPSSLPYTLS